MKIILAVYIVFCLNLSVTAQLKIINKSYDDRSISYTIADSANIVIHETKHKKTIDFGDYFDESKPNELILPARDLLFAIPKNSDVEVTYKIISQKILDGLPELNPQIVIKNDNVIYEKSITALKSSRKFLNVAGKLWIGNNYCLHLNINPFLLNTKNEVVHVEKFVLTLNFKSNNTTTEKITTDKINDIIIDKEYAAGVLSKPELNLSETDSWIDYGKAYIKLGTGKDGVYRISNSDIEFVGVTLSKIDPRTFKMYSKGMQIPIYVAGESDGTFDEGDFIEFFGERNMGGNHRQISKKGGAYNEYLGRYTDTTVYWLTWDGERGLRVNTSPQSTLFNADTLKYYTKIDHYEKNNWFDFSNPNSIKREMPNWSENKTWNEGNLGVGTSNKLFEVSDVYPGTEFKIFVKLQDYASDIETDAHKLTLSLNSTGKWSDTVSINKYEQSVLNIILDSDLLQNGNNTLRIKSIPTNASINACIFDWYEIEYPRFLINENDSLVFRFSYLNNATNANIIIEGVSGNDFVLWKKGYNSKKFIIEEAESNLIFGDTVSNRDEFILSKVEKINAPRIYYSKIFKNLRSIENKGDYIAVTNIKFMPMVRDYCSFIQTQYKIQTKVVNVSDIYDEYSYGFFNPEAIRDFLKSTHLYWQNPKPRYIILIGGATYDYYGNKYKNFSSVKERVINYVPSYGAPVSDNWFVTWDTTGAYIPQMQIGRLPVKSNEQLMWYFNKHKEYVSQKYDDWNKRYLFFSSGDGASQSELDQLRESNKYVIDNFVDAKPVGGQYKHFYKTNNPTTNFGPYTNEDFQDAINNGGVFISYLGHSGTQIWDNSITSPTQLKNNRGRYPVITDFGCSTGKFAEPDIQSFSELFTIGDEGDGIAYAGNSSLGFISTSILAPKLFYQKILLENIFNVSEALNKAKLEMLKRYGSSDIYKLFALTNTLIGDPIISLPIPEKPNFSITGSRINLLNKELTDLNDNAKITIPFNNYGTVPEDSLDILIIHSYEGFTDSLSMFVEAPKFEESVSVAIPVKDKPGLHEITVELDSQNKYDEIFENDNIEKSSFNVASSLLRIMNQYQYDNGITGHIKLLNPTINPGIESMVLELSGDKYFTQKESIEKHFGRIATEINIDNVPGKARVWGRVKIKGSNNYSPVFSFYKTPYKYYLYDEMSNSKLTLDKISFNDNQWSIESNKAEIKIFSAGFEDGQAAIISRNGIDYIPTPMVGHHLVIFDSRPPYDFIKYKYFNTFSGGPGIISSYITFLDSLSDNVLVAFAVSDEGSINDSNLINHIKNYGSKFIDKIKFRSSWSMLGKKGAAEGTVPENISSAGEGAVNIDTTLIFFNNSGSFTTSVIGPSGSWGEIYAEYETPSNSKISFIPIGIKRNGTQDTLSNLQMNKSFSDLSFIDAEIYPRLKFAVNLETGEYGNTPIIHSLGVNYAMPPELGVNYQVVSVSHDSLEAGNDLTLKFDIYNVGGTSAASFSVTVKLMDRGNNLSTYIFKKVIDSIDSSSFVSEEVVINTAALRGTYSLDINVDSENNISEIFEDNNYFTIPFYVIPDTVKPTVSITFDGKDIFEGEYISPHPNILIELTDISSIPINDTSAIRIILDDEPIYYLENKRITYALTNNNPKFTVDFKPELKDGEHSIAVIAKDASGNYAVGNGLKKRFVVSNKSDLIDVYNYPNPLSNDTYFTFKLTQVPDEIFIFIYSISGRLLKEIKRTSAELDYDFNKIYWDGRDEDGDLLGNGVYIYKILLHAGDVSKSMTQKLAIVR